MDRNKENWIDVCPKCSDWYNFLPPQVKVYLDEKYKNNDAVIFINPSFPDKPSRYTSNEVKHFYLYSWEMYIAKESISTNSRVTIESTSWWFNLHPSVRSYLKEKYDTKEIYDLHDLVQHAYECEKSHPVLKLENEPGVLEIENSIKEKENYMTWYKGLDRRVKDYLHSLHGPDVKSIYEHEHKSIRLLPNLKTTDDHLRWWNKQHVRVREYLTNKYQIVSKGNMANIIGKIFRNEITLTK